MTLTIGTGPFGRESAGVFNFTKDGPAHVLYFEDSPRRVRTSLAGETVADSRRVKVLHETGLLPIYYFPRADVRDDLLEATDHTSHCPFKGDASYWSVRVGDRVAENAVWGYPEPLEGAPPLADHVAFYWDAMDAWYEEDEEVFVHLRDPYHRIDVRDSSRSVTVRVNGQTVAESTRPRILFETGLPPRYYLPEADVRADALVPSDTTSECAYKGTASYWSIDAGGEVARDLAWYYPQPNPEAAKVAGHICFLDEKVDMEIDGEPQERPQTKWS